VLPPAVRGTDRGLADRRRTVPGDDVGGPLLFDAVAVVQAGSVLVDVEHAPGQRRDGHIEVAQFGPGHPGAAADPRIDFREVAVVLANGFRYIGGKSSAFGDRLPAVAVADAEQAAQRRVVAAGIERIEIDAVHPRRLTWGGGAEQIVECCGADQVTDLDRTVDIGSHGTASYGFVDLALSC